MLKGKSAIVTGGYRGIGLQVTKTLMDYGMKIVIFCRNETDASSVVESLNEISKKKCKSQNQKAAAGEGHAGGGGRGERAAGRGVSGTSADAAHRNYEIHLFSSFTFSFEIGKDDPSLFISSQFVSHAS